MSCIRPATPGFLLTTIATGLLAVVSFCVPYFKSVFFLKADISSNGLPSGTTCSKPSVGYELDINSLVGNEGDFIQIPNVVVKWLTYVLVLHIVGLALAAGSALFGLLAHVREMAMTYCSTCISGFAAVVTLLAFIFDLAFFFIAKSRINAVGKASIGNAIWLTLAAWILLFFSGCFYTLGRCCISNRQKRGDWDGRKAPPPPGDVAVHDQLRLDAVKAEADRKARQKASEGGLPAFHESVPLTTTAYDDGSNVYADKPHTPGGYVQAPLGSRAVDQYYNNAAQPDPYYNNNTAAGPSAARYNDPNAYPPAGHRQYEPSTYAQSVYSYNAPQQPQNQNPYPDQQYNSIPPLPHTSPPPQQYTPPQQQQQQYGIGREPSNPYINPGGAYLGVPPGHLALRPYEPETQPQSAYYTPPVHSQYTPQSPQTPNGYGVNQVPPLETAGYFVHEPEPQSPYASSSVPTPTTTTTPKGPRNHRQSLQVVNAEDDSPPQYEAGSEHVPGAWGKH
ncbi:hypothetical protein FB45DRAFT_949454 [Roridomyces roridus]|uniref:Pali-domain-containing protein n=1 Tax=Roridomyces roridus TaxID=1738132 RepID=A0AAD7F9R5_9AGAR|nr:hypothetical protein FB45DRAFT_949454 [Roridomyces roridus]